VLAQRFSEAHPWLNLALGATVVLLIVALVVFAKPIGRLLGRLNRRLLQALGLAAQDRDPDGEDDRR
jgi:hypothetical protein